MFCWLSEQVQELLNAHKTCISIFGKQNYIIRKNKMVYIETIIYTQINEGHKGLQTNDKKQGDKGFSCRGPLVGEKYWVRWRLYLIAILVVEMQLKTHWLKFSRKFILCRMYKMRDHSILSNTLVSSNLRAKFWDFDSWICWKSSSPIILLYSLH